MVIGFSHVQLVVRDVDASLAWYARVLGMVELVRGETATGPYAALRHPEAGFVVGMQRATEAQLPGLASSALDHLSFAVADRDALERHCAALRAAGIDVGDIFDEAVSHNARLRDPDGLVVELTAPRRRDAAPAQFQTGSSG